MIPVRPLHEQTRVNMDSIILILELFGGVILLLGVGYLVGHSFRINNYIATRTKANNSDDNTN